MTDQQPAETTNNKSFQIERLYVQEQSCKVPHAPTIFADLPALSESDEKPKTTIEMNLKFSPLPENRHEVTLQVQVSARHLERTLYNAEIEQVGIFKITEFGDEELPVLLNIHCPQVLFPYLRKTLSDMVSAAGFMPLTLDPVSFEAIYQQKMSQQKHQGDSEASEPDLSATVTDKDDIEDVSLPH